MPNHELYGSGPLEEQLVLITLLLVHECGLKPKVGIWCQLLQSLVEFLRVMV